MWSIINVFQDKYKKYSGMAKTKHNKRLFKFLIKKIFFIVIFRFIKETYDLIFLAGTPA
jgi:hypothetical protein